MGHETEMECLLNLIVVRLECKLFFPNIDRALSVILLHTCHRPSACVLRIPWLPC
jgi:hypothetical protein